MVLKTNGEIDLMDEANRIVHRVLDGIAERVRPGVTTRELDQWAEATIRDAGAVPAFLNYRGYPATLCTSINDVIVHGIPDDRPLAEGDIMGVDCGVLYKGYYGDAARTFDDPVKSDQILGKVVSIERNGNSLNPYSLQHKLTTWLFKATLRLKSILGIRQTAH